MQRMIRAFIARGSAVISEANPGDSAWEETFTQRSMLECAFSISKRVTILRSPAMPKKVNRRGFLKGGAAAGLSTAIASTAGARAAQDKASQTATAPLVPKESDPQALNSVVLTNENPGSDFMIDVVKSLGFEYIAANPGSSFRGLQESIINYGKNEWPEFLTCCHEESAVGIAHGYAKIAGKPMAVALHSTVGTQHASMAIYNAYCDRVPVMLFVGNLLDAPKRRPGVEWDHSAVDVAAMIRDYTKWDDLPFSLQHYAESTVRAYKIAMAPPMMPVTIVIDAELQENPIPNRGELQIPKLTLVQPPQGDSASVAETARLLVGAENPVIIVERVTRTANGMRQLIELAELLQAPVIDQRSRLNFPTRHPLNHTERANNLLSQADVILGLELNDFWGVVHSYRDQLERTSKFITKRGAKFVSISLSDLYVKGNYQDIERYPELDLAIAGDVEATLPSLVEAVNRLITSDRKGVFRDRGKKLADAHAETFERTRAAATYGWDGSPITTARLSAEIWGQIRNDDWSLVSDVAFLSRWPLRLWSFEKDYQYIGAAGGFGEGYGLPAAVGAALANRKYGRLSVNIQCDGDMMYAPGVLWTAAHHRIPLLTVMHNNRAYHQEVMHIQRMADRRNRGITQANIGTALDDPNIDYSKMAQSMGVYGEGPITDPKDLGPALRRAIDVVKQGKPALVDVVTEPR
jgi:acetolactate synthase-1/2/3 large subunit